MSGVLDDDAPGRRWPLPVPSQATLSLLREGLTSGERLYARQGGGRDFRYEDALVSAKAWLSTLEVWSQR
jgi:hypothetical protein